MQAQSTSQVKVALCAIATGKYGRFVAQFWESARTHFLPRQRVTLFLFGDKDPGLPCEFVATGHRPWPGPTLYRYHAMLGAKAKLREQDYVFYCDVDTRFVASVGEEVLGDLVVVVHPGYAGCRRSALPYEDRPASRACVPPEQGTHYFAGGFQGGRTGHFLQAMHAMREAVDDDDGRGVTARWHDESHWNRYCLKDPPSVVLPPTYLCPESWPMPGRKLLALDKNHAEVRDAL